MEMGGGEEYFYVREVGAGWGTKDWHGQGKMGR